MDTEKKNILVPIDFTEQSFIGLEQAYILEKTADAEIKAWRRKKRGDSG